MIGQTRWRFRSVTSTQDIAFHLAALGAPAGTLVRADYQTAGRGRLGRTWEVPANTALTFSALLRPDIGVHQLGPLSIQTAHALCQAFTAAGARNVSLKWPNDVLISGRKVSGILVQTRRMPAPVAIVGIGVNLTSPPDGIPATATSLARELEDPIAPDEMFERCISALDGVWRRWHPTIPGDQVDEIDQLLWCRGERVTLLDADREITGRALGIAPDGGLRMLIDGQERTIHAGEITRGPRPIDPGSEP